MTDLLADKRPSNADATQSGESHPHSPMAKGVANQPAGQEPASVDLATFHWNTASELPDGQREALLAKLKSIPRPPKSLHKLISPEFLAKATSTAMSELIMSEPMIAAKVLSTVNSPLYGLKRTVTGIGQAITFLGMNTVRNLCVQYMLAEAFKPSHPGAQRAFDDVWRASALASEVCVRLNKALELPDSGGLTTQVVLGFVGHLAMASLLPANALGEWLTLDRLNRAHKEQTLMGLNSSEIGNLLMIHWGMPAALAESVLAADRILVTPPSDAQTEMANSAFVYFCTRLGERMAKRQIKTLRDYDPTQDAGPDTLHLNAHLLTPAFSQLPKALAATSFQNAMEQMLNGAPD